MNRILSKIVHNTYKYRLPSWKNSHVINFPFGKKIYQSNKIDFTSRSFTIYLSKNQCKKSEKDYANDPEVKEWLKEISADFKNEMNDEGKKCK